MPGQFIQEELDARQWTQRDLASILGIEETALIEIINAGVSLEMSKALATAFDVDDDLFANLQKTYDLSVEQK